MEYVDEPISAWGCVSTLAILLIALFLLITFAFWATEHTARYDPFKGSYIDYLINIFRVLWNLIKDIF